MVQRRDLVRFLDDLLPPLAGCHDGSNNGLQVEGACDVRKVAFGVDACLVLFERAAEIGADFIVVHHGLSWGGGIKRFTGIHARRFAVLFKHDISLYASHLPMDAHPEVGHNAEIARGLGLRKLRPYFEYDGAKIGWRGELPRSLTPAALGQKVGHLLDAEVEVVAAGPARIRSVGVVSGGGGCAIEDSAEDGLDCLVTGETGHGNHHPIREAGINVIAAGHYKTEVPGLKAVMARIEKRFRVPCEFIDFPTGK